MKDIEDRRGQDGLFHFVYETENIVSGSYYIGVRSCEDPLNDNYLGSGTALKDAVRKYGVEKFRRRIFCFLPTREDAFKLEEQLVVKPWEYSKCYNLVSGGAGGSGTARDEKYRKKMSRVKKQNFKDPKVKARHAMALRSKEVREKLSKKAKERWADPERRQMILEQQNEGKKRSNRFKNKNKKKKK